MKVDRVLNLNDQLLVLMLQIRVGSLESKKLIIPAFDLICAHYIEQPANSRAKSDKKLIFQSNFPQFWAKVTRQSIQQY